MTSKPVLQDIQLSKRGGLTFSKRKFVNFVRELTNLSRAGHFASLKTRIQEFLVGVAFALRGKIVAERGVTLLSTPGEGPPCGYQRGSHRSHATSPGFM